MKNIKGYKEMIMESMHKKDINDELLDAAGFGSRSTVEELLDKGADPNTKGIRGLSPLHRSAMRGDAYITQMLIDRGADINSGDEKGELPIHKAAYRGNVETIDTLINAGSDPNAEDIDSRFFPLKWAAFQGNVDAVIYLIKRGADANKMDWAGKTSIFYLIGRNVENKGEVIGALIKGGADVMKEDRAGRSTLIRAKESDPVMLQAILTHSRDVLKNFDWKEIVDAFGGNEADVPEEVSARWNRMKRGKSAFGM